MTRLECTCPEWAPNIEKVNAPLMLMHARNPHQGNMYRGVQFRYCPWCGQPLEETEVQQGSATDSRKAGE